MKLAENEMNLKHLTNYLRQWVALQVQQHRPRLETRPELKKAVQGQGGHVRFTPPLSSLLHLLLELHPPDGSTERGNRWATHRVLWAWLQLCWWCPPVSRGVQLSGVTLDVTLDDCETVWTHTQCNSVLLSGLACIATYVKESLEYLSHSAGWQTGHLFSLCGLKFNLALMSQT